MSIFVTLGLMLVLLLGGLWIGVALALTGAIASYPWVGLENILVLLAKQCWNLSTNFTLVALPLYVFMGNLLFDSGLGNKVYAGLSKAISGLPGGLLHSVIGTCAVFAACSSSSAAMSAMMGNVAYPELRERGYDKRLSLGSITAGGTLGPLIPPSVFLIIYGVVAELSVGALFVAALFPGIVMAGMFSIYIVIRCALQPGLAPKEKVKVSFRERAKALRKTWQGFLLIVIVLGGIYGGVATPTEVAAIGAIAVLVLTAIDGKLSLTVLRKSISSATCITCMVYLIIIGASMMSSTLVFYHIPTLIPSLVSALGGSANLIFLVVCALYIIMGCFFDPLSMMVITLPFIVPVMKAAGWDLMWFGVTLVVLLEMAVLTPPVGISLFIVQGVTKEALSDVTIGSMQFVFVQMVMVGVLVLFPGLILWLPSVLPR